MKRIPFDELKHFLQGRLDLDEFARILPKLEQLYGDELTRVQGLPEDVISLALSNDCAISTYVDFHATDKFDQCRSRYACISSRLGADKDKLEKS